MLKAPLSISPENPTLSGAKKHETLKPAELRRRVVTARKSVCISPEKSVQALWDYREVTSHAFNFTALAALYRDAIRNKKSTLAFKVQNGVGQFLFAMFFSDDDKILGTSCTFF